MPAIVYQICIKLRPINCDSLEEGPELDLHRLLSEPGGRVVAAEHVNEVVRHEVLDPVQGGRGADAHLLHGIGGQDLRALVPPSTQKKYGITLAI